jgi:hypothetical protein
MHFCLYVFELCCYYKKSLSSKMLRHVSKKQVIEEKNKNEKLIF